MAIIEKKINPEYFDAIESGKKKYELRLADTPYQVGDTLLLKEWDDSKKEYTGRELQKTITYTRTFKIDDLHWSREDIDEKGLTLVSFE